MFTTLAATTEETLAATTEETLAATTEESLAATSEDSTVDVDEVEAPITVKETPTTLNDFTTIITPTVTEDFFGFGSFDVQSDENCPQSCSQ